jgi:putative N6-adenine-specific DNA methylase/tRNA (guanine6-N2)-methyltransferase
MRFLLTSDEGLEDVVIDEIRELCPTAQARPDPSGFPGLVVTDGVVLSSLLRLTTIQHVIEIRGEARVASLEQIARAVAQIEIAEMSKAASFRVTSERRGKHAFGHMEIQRVAGGALHDRYGTTVDLEGYELNVRVDLYGERMVAGVQRTRDSLGRRIKRPRALRTSLKPTVAAAMLRLIGAHRGEGRLIDPLCGTGTIPVEAKRINPRLQVFAGDWDEPTVETARGTVANHDLDIEVRLCDARTLTLVYPEPFDYIVTDPPYGVRQARRVDMAELYGVLLTEFERALRDSGTIALVVLKLRAFVTALEGTGLRVVQERLIESGGLHPRIFVLQKA